MRNAKLYYTAEMLSLWYIPVVLSTIILENKISFSVEAKWCHRIPKENAATWGVRIRSSTSTNLFNRIKNREIDTSRLSSIPNTSRKVGRRNNFQGEIFRARFLTEPSLQLLVMHVSFFLLLFPFFPLFCAIASRSGNFIAGHFSSLDHRWGSWRLVMDACVPKPTHLVQNPTRGWHQIDRSCGSAYTSADRA